MSSQRTIPVLSLLGELSLTEPRVYRQFSSRLVKKHKLTPVKFHELLYIIAIRAIEISDFDIKSLSEILGHKNVSFTLNVHGRANLQQKIKCMNLLNNLF